jgi:hypothetical protein
MVDRHINDRHTNCGSRIPSMNELGTGDHVLVVTSQERADQQAASFLDEALIRSAGVSNRAVR